jgi:capsular polysaccharide biosynthesis protein
MNICGDNVIIFKDNNIESYENKEYKITGEKIIEMFDNHKNTFKYYFGENNTYKYYDIFTIYKKYNIYYCFGNLVNFTLLSRLNVPKINGGKVKVIEKCAFIKSMWGENYYHFLTEEIVNIIKINKFDSNIPIIINYNDKYIQDILNLFKFNNPIIKLDNDDCLKIEQCYIPNMSISGKPSKKELSLIRDTLLEKNIINFQKMDIGIIIKRNEYERHLINFDEVYNHLINKYKNIEWKIFENLNITETIKLFSKCKIIIAPHGAGLTNMLFAPNGCSIIELMPYSDPNECYFHLSNMLDHEYNCIVVEDSGKNNGKQMNLKLEYLDKILKTLN